MTPGGTISTSPTFNSTLREPTATPPPQPGPFGPPSGLFGLRRPSTPLPSMHAACAGAHPHPAGGARAVRAAVGVVRAAPAVHNLAINERRATAGDDVIALGLKVVRDGALKGVRRRIGHLFSTRGRLGRSLGIATTGGSLCIASPASSLSLPDRHHALLRAMNDAQLH